MKTQTNTIEKRNQESMRKNFISCPGDKYTIKGSSNCISNSITVMVSNSGREEKFFITMRNNLDAWKMLKKLDDMGGRTVLDQIDNNAPIPFKDSMPYKHRFN